MPLTLTAESTEFVTLAEVKAHLNKTGTTDDAEVEMIRGASQDVVEGIIGPVLWRDVTETVYANGGTALLSQAPIVSVTSATSYDVAQAVTLSSGSGLLRDVDTYGPLVVTYVAGREVVPDAVRLATLIVAAHLWRTQQGVSPAQFGDDDVTVTPMGFAIPNRALELLRPYALGPTVA